MGEPVFVETWEVISDKGNILNIAYTKSMCPTGDATDMFRLSMAENHSCVLKRLLSTRKIEFELGSRMTTKKETRNEHNTKRD